MRSKVNWFPERTEIESIWWQAQKFKFKKILSPPTQLRTADFKASVRMLLKYTGNYLFCFKRSSAKPD